MGSDFSNSGPKININDFYNSKQLLFNQVGKPILLQAKSPHSTLHNQGKDFIKIPFIEKYSFATLQKQFNFQEQQRFYELRRPLKIKSFQNSNQSNYSNQQFFIKKQNQLQKTGFNNNVVQVFQYTIEKEPYSKCLNNDYILQVYTEHISIRLANIKKTLKTENNPSILWSQMLYQEALYVYFSSLKGYNQIYENFYSFKENLALPTQYSIGFNYQGEVKVWINHDFSKNFSKSSQKHSFSEIINQIIQLIAQRCIHRQKFQNSICFFKNTKTSFSDQICHLQRSLYQIIKIGKQKIKNRFKTFQKDDHRWRYSREKLSMKSHSITNSPAIQKTHFAQPKSIKTISQQESTNQQRKRYHSQSKLKQPTLFYNQKGQNYSKKTQNIFQPRLRSASQSYKYPFGTNTLRDFNNKLNLNSTFKNVEIRNNEISLKQPNKNVLGSASNSVYMSPAVKKSTPPSPSKNNAKFDDSNYSKNNISQTVTNIYSLTNHGSPLYFQNPSQFYQNKPVATLLSDPFVVQSSKRNKQAQNNQLNQDKLYYKNKSFKQNQMARFIQQKLNFRQSAENRTNNKNQKSNRSNRTTSELGKKSSSKLFFQDSNKQNEKIQLTQIKQFVLKDSQQVKVKNMFSTGIQETAFELQIQGFQKVKQNKPICETSRKNLPIIQNFQQNSHKSFSNQDNNYNQSGNSHLSVFQYQNKQQLHHSISSVKIPTSVQLQSSRSLANKQKEDFNQDSWLKKEQSLKEYKLNLQKAIHSQQIQQIRPMIMQKNYETVNFKQVLDQKYQASQKNMMLSSEQLASQFKKLLQSVQIQIDDEENQYKSSGQLKDYQLQQLLIKKQSSKKKQTLDDFIDQFNIQITQMSEEDDQSVIDKNDIQQINSN